METVKATPVLQKQSLKNERLGCMKNIPPWLQNIHYDDEIVMVDEKEFKSMVDETTFECLKGWCGGKFPFAKPFEEYLVNTDGMFIGKIGDNDMDACVAWFKPVIDRSCSISECYSLLVELSDEERNNIIEEMISKVDIKRFTSILNIGNKSSSRSVSKESINKYLHKWAESKLEFYLAFGRNLTVSRQIEFKIDVNEMTANIISFASSHLQYAPYIFAFDPTDYINNQFSGSFSRFGHPVYQRSSVIQRPSQNMKLTKWFSKTFNDSKFDVDLSMLIQNNKVNGTFVISIDPYDYLTQSCNCHGWSSCMDVSKTFDESYVSGILSYMLDDATLVSYRDNGKIYNYSFYGIQFSGNSKSWRQLIHVDKETCSAIFNREYPAGTKSELAHIVRELFEETIAGYLNKPNNWVNYGNYKGGYSFETRFGYNDIPSRDVVSIFPSSYESISRNIRIGVPELINLVNGSKTTNRGLD